MRLHFHDLRGTTVTLLSESGSTPQQIAAITGHSLKTVHRILERYLARTSGLAEQAIFNWENSPRTKFANQLQTGTCHLDRLEGESQCAIATWLARPEGFEPPTPKFVVWCSIQLSYGRLLRCRAGDVPEPALAAGNAGYL